MSKQEIVVEWESPSNLAIVKYWGKKNIQKPKNANISFSLKKSVTKTKVEAILSEKAGFDFYLNDELKPDFNSKISVVFDNIFEKYLKLRDYHFKIYSSNSFPHSSGIASSASGMSALAFCLMDIASQVYDQSIDYSEVSELSRIGSGSAARSVYSGWTIWGKHPSVEGSSDNFAVKLESIHPNFNNIGNAILIVSSDVKKVSSSAGHKLMDGHPYAEARIIQANTNVEKLLKILEKGDWNEFLELAENEALSLHALMMSSNPGYSLMEPISLKIIDKIQNARREEGLPVGFSMDAGPNVHLLYDKSQETKVLKWIDEEIHPLVSGGEIIFDEIGFGPKKITNS